MPIDDEDLTHRCCGLTAPVNVKDTSGDASSFFTWPVLGPLLFENETSDARDHCANERTFLSYLRLSIFMTVVAVAIALSFHLTSEPSELEKSVSRPLGFLFWVLALAMLFLGLANYIGTVNKYSRRAAIVQSGWKTQAILGIVATCIIGTCVVLLVITKIRESQISS